MAKEYKVKLEIDNSQAKEAAQEAVAAQAAAEKAAKRFGDEVEKGAAKVRDAQGRFVAGQGQVTQSINRAGDAHTEAFGKSIGLTGQLSGGVQALIGQFGLLGGAAGVVNMIAGAFAKASNDAYSAQKMVKDYREALLELAALKGKLGQTSDVVGEDLGTRAKTLQTAAQSREFQKAYLGVGASAIDTKDSKRLISEEESKKFGIMAGRFQAAEGGPAETHATLAGMMPTLMGKRVSADEAFRKEMQLYGISQPGGADFTPMIGQFLKNAPLVTGGLISPERSMALHSAFSVTNREGFGENVQQLVRATVGGLGRMRGAGVEGSEKEAEYLKGLHATNQMDPIEIAKLISDDMKRQEKEDQGKGLKFNAMDYLKHHGYANQEEIMSLIGFHGMNKTGQFDKGFLSLTDKMPTKEEAEAPLGAFAAGPIGMQRRADLAGEATTIAAGAGPMEYMQSLHQTAFNRLKAGGAIGISGEYKDVSSWDPLTNARIRREESRMANEERGRLKLPEMDFAAETERGRAELHWRSAQEVASRGGDVLPGIDELIRVGKEALESSKRLEEAVKGGRPATPPPEPVPDRAPAQLNAARP